MVSDNKWGPLTVTLSAQYGLRSEAAQRRNYGVLMPSHMYVWVGANTDLNGNLRHLVLQRKGCTMIQRELALFVATFTTLLAIINPLEVLPV